MSDYGFATFDERNERRLGSINSKWPIFGPKYSDIKFAFKTIHITDTYEQNYVSSPNVRLPNADNDAGYSELTDRGKNRVLVATIPHGYDFRPLGYVQFSGNVKFNTRWKWKYDNIVTTYGNYSPSLSPLYGLTTEDCGYTSAPGFIYALNRSNALRPEYGYFNVQCPSNVPYYLGNSSYAPSVIVDFQEPTPYSFEIDEKNIYIYRTTYWVDDYIRYYYYSDYLGRVAEDQRARRQGVMDWAGSSVDLTIYLCPYKMEDLL